MEQKNSFKFFANKDCGFYPCHQNADPNNFNCLFCYCPLYALGDKCGGNFVYIEGGVKDCSDCLIPHSEKGYMYIMNKWPEIMELAKKKDDENK